MTNHCDNCGEEETLVGSWISNTGMTIMLYQCPSCKGIEIYSADKKVHYENNCPRCGSENIKQIGGGMAVEESLCTDCGLIFKESAFKNSNESKTSK